MAITNGYITLPDAKTWIGLAASDFIDDPVIEQAVEAVSRWVDSYCNRHFWQDVAASRHFDTYDGVVLNFGAYNDLVSVTSVKVDDNNDGVWESTLLASDYQLLPLNPAAGPELRPYTGIRSTGRWLPIRWGYPARYGLIEITGTWGWPAVPDAVVQACKIQVSRIVKRKQSPEGVAGWGDYGPIRISGKLDPDVAMMLTDYRLEVVA